MTNKLGLTQAQVQELQGILRECYAQGKEAGFPVQIFFLWSKMDLSDAETLSRVLLLLRGQVQSIASTVSMFAPGTQIQGMQYLIDWTERFYDRAHLYIDDAAKREADNVPCSVPGCSLEREPFHSHSSISSDKVRVLVSAPDSHIQGLRYFDDWVQHFFVCAHSYIDDAAKRDLAREMYPGESSSSLSPVEEEVPPSGSRPVAERRGKGWDDVIQITKELKCILFQERRERLIDILSSLNEEGIRLFCAELEGEP